MTTFRLWLLTLLALAFSPVGLALAQNAPVPAQTPPPAQAQGQAEAPPLPADPSVQPPDGVAPQNTAAPQQRPKRQYAKATPQNLSKLYWAMGMFDAEKDAAAIDNFILINECEIYQKYFTNDFEWRQIHEAMKQKLIEGKRDFNKRFQFVQPIELGRYNFEKEAFDVVTESLYNGMRRIETSDNLISEGPCGRRSPIEGYPANVILNLSRPFVLRSVPMKKAEAQDYLSRILLEDEDKKRGSRQEGISNPVLNRTAYLRIRVNILKFMSYQKNNYNEDLASFAATIERYDVFEDPELTKPIHSSVR